MNFSINNSNFDVIKAYENSCRNYHKKPLGLDDIINAYKGSDTEEKEEKATIELAKLTKRARYRITNTALEMFLKFLEPDLEGEVTHVYVDNDTNTIAINLSNCNKGCEIHDGLKLPEHFISDYEVEDKLFEDEDLEDEND